MSEARTTIEERVDVAALDERMERIGLWASLLAAAIATVVLSGDLWQIVLGHTLSDWQHTALRIAAIVGAGIGIIGMVASCYHYLRLAWRFVVRHIKPSLRTEVREFAQDRALDLPDVADQVVREHAHALRGCRTRVQPPAAVGVAAAAIIIAAATLRASGSPAGPIFFTHVTSYSMPTGATGLALDRNGDIWFIGPKQQDIERLAPNGSVTTIPLTIPGTSQALSITTGPDGNIWVGEDAYAQVNGTFSQPCSYWNGAILRITPSGSVTAFPMPPSDSACVGNSSGFGPQPTQIRPGPDGQLWYALAPVSFGDVSQRIEHITTDGRISRFSLPNDPETGHSLEGDFTFGADGSLWFSTSKTYSGHEDKIIHVSPSGAILGDYPVPGMTGSLAGGFIDGLVAGPDGAIWFGVTPCCAAMPGHIGRITANGTVKLTALPDDLVPTGAPIVGPDHNFWLMVSGTAPGARASRTSILRITPSLAITQYVLPEHPIQFGSMMFGPDGTLWLLAYSGTQQNARLVLDKITI